MFVFIHRSSRCNFSRTYRLYFEIKLFVYSISSLPNSWSCFFIFDLLIFWFFSFLNFRYSFGFASLNSYWLILPSQNFLFFYVINFYLISLISLLLFCEGSSTTDSDTMKKLLSIPTSHFIINWVGQNKIKSTIMWTYKTISTPLILKT